MIEKSGIVATNKKAAYNYFIFDKYEAGIALKGCEVKSLRLGRANLADSYVKFKGQEAVVVNLHITSYAMSDNRLYDPRGERKLLLHKLQIAKLMGQTAQKGFALIPLRLYFKKGVAKLEIALCKGKRQYDKRESIKKKVYEREMERGMRRKQ